jgi:hypothetical protein
MSGAIAGSTFGAIWLTATLWAVLDSESRGRSPFVWGLLTFFLGPFALGAYAITADRDGRSPAEGRRTYFFTASFFFLGVSYATLVALLAVALDAGVAAHPIGSHDARVAIAILLAVLVFATPLWAFHWVVALGLLEDDSAGGDGHALFLLVRRYGAVVLVIAGLVTIGFGIYLVFTLIAALMGVFDGGRDRFLPVLAFLPLTVVLMAYHWMAIFGSSHYRRLAADYEGTIATPSSPSGGVASG